jgi:hypothetical protein
MIVFWQLSLDLAIDRIIDSCCQYRRILIFRSARSEYPFR